MSHVAALRPLKLGDYPTPVERVASLSTRESTLWVKRDDQSAPDYGGNKVRKLERILACAVDEGAKRLVTMGAAGSHHVLATAHFAARVGIGVDAVLVPQRRTSHVVDNLRALVATGARIFPVRAQIVAPFVALRLSLAKGARFVPLGGSNVEGAMGYFDAARELAAQIRVGDLPEPDAVVAPLGSGGTVAGIVAGLAAAGLRSTVVAVAIARPVWYLAFSVRRLARACARRAGIDIGSLDERLVVESRYVGAGYGEPTAEGERATLDGATAGLTLDSTYTAKALAAALAIVRSGARRNVLYWHTLSSAPLGPLLMNAPAERDLSPKLTRILR